MRRAVVLFLALLPAAARADQVFTRGGGLLEGEIVERRTDSIVVDIGGGTIGLPLSYVERIVPGASPAARFRARAERLPPDDVAGWLALGRWARQQDLRSQAGEAFLHVLSQDPGNPAAHQALGHVKVGGEWMAPDDANRARGLVSYDGRWMTADERNVLIAEREAVLEQERAEAESLVRLRESEARALEAEAQARIAQAEARIAEEQADRVEAAPLGLEWVPPGFGGFVSTGFVSTGFPHRFAATGFPRAFAPSCRRAALGVGGAVHVPGRGGALVVSGGPRVIVRR
jgi:hypothetical protein